MPRNSMAGTVVIVPCFNEEKRLDVRRFRAFSDSVGDVRICFVDDGSTDGTAEILAELTDYDENVFEVLRLPRNSGKAEAVRRGFQTAFPQRPEFVGYWDADLSTALEDIVTFRDLLRERRHFDMVFGSRVKLLGRRIERNELRHYLGRVFATFVSFMLNLPIYDTQCGAKLFRVTPHFSSLFDQPFQTRWFFDVEIIARHMALVGRISGLRAAEDVIYELPLMEWVNAEASKVGITTYFGAAFDLLTIFLHYKLYRRVLGGGRPE